METKASGSWEKKTESGAMRFELQSSCAGGLSGEDGIVLRYGRPNEKQKRFLLCHDKKYIAYGGARGGGKSWALRVKAISGALRYDGIKILLIRRTYKDLNDHVMALLKMTVGLARYSDSKKEFSFANGSKLMLGYYERESDIQKYQGQEFDWIFIDEATQLSELQFVTLKGSLRGVNKIPKRMYLTCNPGGVGHAWVKRLFIDRLYTADENADEYEFIPAKVYDNTALLKADPGYVNMLKTLPPDLKKAWLDGSWDIFAGQYFREFDREVHVARPFALPQGWQRFRAMDYGQDTCCCLWCAVDTQGRVTVYRELHEPGLILSVAAGRIVDLTPNAEAIRYTVASPDLWNRQQSSGESGAEVMAKAGLKGLVPADNSRVAGWRLLREYLKPEPDEFGQISARLKIFDCCPNLIRSLPALLYDERNTEDCATEPHPFTHAPDALRYGLMSRPPLPKAVIAVEEPLPDSHRARQPVLGGKVNIKGLW